MSTAMIVTPPSDHLLTVRQAAQLLGFKPETLRRWAGRNLPVVRLPQSRTIRYRRSDVERLITSGKTAN
jgi:excisionase family DNA binding protein